MCNPTFLTTFLHALSPNNRSIYHPLRILLSKHISGGAHLFSSSCLLVGSNIAVVIPRVCGQPPCGPRLCGNKAPRVLAQQSLIQCRIQTTNRNVSRRSAGRPWWPGRLGSKHSRLGKERPRKLLCLLGRYPISAYCAYGTLGAKNVPTYSLYIMTPEEVAPVFNSRFLAVFT